ncbi:MAG: Ig-like domain-containing protein [Chloroflexota bacterium]
MARDGSMEAWLRRLISLGSIAVAIVVLGLVLYNATLVDRRAPTVSEVRLSATVGGAERLAQTVTAIDITFSEAVDHASAESRILIVPSVSGVVTWDGQTAIFTPAERLPIDVAFEVSVAPGFSDLAGNVATSGLEPWAFRSVGAPTVVAVEPADGSTELSVDTAIVVRFDRLMDTASVERSIRLEPPVPTRPSWSGETLTLTSVAPFRFGTTYSISIGGQAADTGGNRLGAPFTSRFSTVRAGVAVKATVPADTVSGIGVRTPIAVIFDAPIDPATVGRALTIDPPIDGSLQVVALPSDLEPTEEGAAPDPARQRVLLFSPSAPLAEHTTYRVTLAPEVARLGDPGRVAPGRSWVFTTGSPTVSAQNQVAFLSARGGTRGVWLMNPDGTNQRQLTTTLAPISGFDVSSDGSLIAFAAAGVVSTMAIDGSSQTAVTQPGQVEAAPKFTPDGRSLVVGRRDASGADRGYWRVPAPGTLVGGLPTRQLLPDGAPPLGSVALTGDGDPGGPGTSVWSTRAAFDPTGRWLLLATGSGDVRLMDLDPGFGLEPVTTDVGLVADAAPVWVATRGGFAVVAREPSSQAIAAWIVRPDGARTSLGPAAGSVAAGSDGSLAFVESDPPTGTTRVVLLRASGERVAITTARPGSDDRWPRFAPGGGSIVFGRVSAGGAGAADGSDGIWTVRVSTGVVARLTADGVQPGWLP